MIERERMRARMARALGRPANRLDDGAVLTELMVDSFDLVDVVIDLQETSGVTLVHEDLRGVRTVGDLLGVLERKSR